MINTNTCEMVFPFLFLYDKNNLVSKFITYYHLLALDVLDLLLTGTIRTSSISED